MIKLTQDIFITLLNLVRKDHKFRRKSIWVFIMTIFFIGANVLAPLILKNLTESLQYNYQPITMIYGMVAGYCVLWVLAQATEQTRELLICRHIEQATAEIIGIYYRQIAINKEKCQIGTGAEIALLTHFQESFPNLVWGLLFYIFPLALQVILTTFIIGYVCGITYSGIFCLMALTFTALTYFGTQRYLRLQTKAVDKSIELYDFLSDHLLNIENIHLFGHPDREDQELKSFLDANVKAQTSARNKFELLRIYQGVVIGTALLVAMLLSVYAVFYKQQNLGHFVLINSYTLQLLGPLTWLGYVLIDITKGIAGVEKVLYPLILCNPYKPIEVVPTSFQRISEIEFRNILFSYKTSSNSSSPALQDISFSVSRGESLGIVGKSGSGKSTVAKILASLVSPQEGALNFNGLDAYKHGEIIEQISIVPQTIHLFNQSLLYNISYACPQASKKEIERAIELAELKPFIERLPKGLETCVGELGCQLSGGERQRIALARALLKKFSCIIFDEFSAHLDAITLNKIKGNLRSLSAETIQIFISHQLSSLTDMDRIIVLESGKIAEIGNHNTLLSNQGLYANLWNEQEKGSTIY